MKHWEQEQLSNQPEAEEDVLTWESETTVRWTSGARRRAPARARSCSSSRCSSGGRPWSPAGRRDTPPTRSPWSDTGSWSRRRCGRGERSSTAPEMGEQRSRWTNSVWRHQTVNDSEDLCESFLQEVQWSPVRWRSSRLWCSLLEPGAG